VRTRARTGKEAGTKTRIEIATKPRIQPAAGSQAATARLGPSESLEWEGRPWRRSIVPEQYIPHSDPGKPKFQTRLPDYFFTGVKVISNDHKSPFDFFLILLANRFNSAYYLLLNTGKWSGGETSAV
jgi:hypothetical protein